MLDWPSLAPPRREARDTTVSQSQRRRQCARRLTPTPTPAPIPTPIRTRAQTQTPTKPRLRIRARCDPNTDAETPKGDRRLARRRVRQLAHTHARALRKWGINTGTGTRRRDAEEGKRQGNDRGTKCNEKRRMMDKRGVRTKGKRQGMGWRKIKACLSCSAQRATLVSRSSSNQPASAPANE